MIGLDVCLFVCICIHYQSYFAIPYQVLTVSSRGTREIWREYNKCLIPSDLSRAKTCASTSQVGPASPVLSTILSSFTILYTPLNTPLLSTYSLPISSVLLFFHTPLNYPFHPSLHSIMLEGVSYMS